MVGFPNVGLQGFAPKPARGDIAALSGAQDDARYFQISVPVQRRERGCPQPQRVGTCERLETFTRPGVATLLRWGQPRALPENVNYAVKGGFLHSFLEAVPEVSAKLKVARTAERKYEDVVREAEQAAVLVLVY